MRNEFTAVYEQEGDLHIAYCIEIPGAYSEGKTKEEARAKLVEVIGIMLEQRRERSLRDAPPEAILETIVIREPEPRRRASHPPGAERRSDV